MKEEEKKRRKGNFDFFLIDFLLRRTRELV